MAFIIAIDFGTAYSGYVFSITKENEKLNPQSRLWGQEYGQKTPKTPTCILFDENQQFKALGYDALEIYLTMGREAKKYYFFKDFKMELYGQKITKNLQIKDVNGKSMSALKVFSAALRFLKDDALETINKHATNFKFTASDFTWVLTVPAIWDAPAKQFMRKAAEQAEIVSEYDPEKLVIALEPEGASVWCRKLPTDGFISQFSPTSERISQSPGTKYIVVDCGGGTIDITVHEILQGGALKELHRASGNDKGGQHVDKLFKESLREFFCDGQWDEYEEKHPSGAQTLLNKFAIDKQFEKKPNPVILTCDGKLERIVDSNPSLEKIKGLAWDDGRIKISQEKMVSFFQDSLYHIEENIKDILAKQIRINYILLVGGFAQCEILRENVHQKFSKKAKVLCPMNPQTAIMNGALEFGRDKSVIRSRKSAFTYGVNMSVTFDRSKHKPEKKYTSDSGVLCGDIFKKLVGIDEDVESNETRDFDFRPININQTSCTFEFYRTEQHDATYVDDWGVEGPIASCTVAMPDTRKGLDRKIKLHIYFGATEITANVTDVESNSTASAKMDFMSQ